MELELQRSCPLQRCSEPRAVQAPACADRAIVGGVGAVGVGVAQTKAGSGQGFVQNVDSAHIVSLDKMDGLRAGEQADAKDRTHCGS